MKKKLSVGDVRFFTIAGNGIDAILHQLLAGEYKESRITDCLLETRLMIVITMCLLELELPEEERLVISKGLHWSIKEDILKHLPQYTWLTEMLPTNHDPETSN